MARTLETLDTMVEGGPADGMRLQVKIKDDGLAYVSMGDAFLGENGNALYFYDAAANVVRYRDDTGA